MRKESWGPGHCEQRIVAGHGGEKTSVYPFVEDLALLRSRNLPVSAWNRDREQAGKGGRNHVRSGQTYFDSRRTFEDYSERKGQLESEVKPTDTVSPHRRKAAWRRLRILGK